MLQKYKIKMQNIHESFTEALQAMDECIDDLVKNEAQVEGRDEAFCLKMSLKSTHIVLEDAKVKAISDAKVRKGSMTRSGKENSKDE